MLPSPPPVLLLLLPLLLLKYSTQYFKDYLHSLNFFSSAFKQWNVYYVRMSHKINVIAQRETDFCFLYLFLQRKENPNICQKISFSRLFQIMRYDSKDCLRKFHLTTTKKSLCVCTLHFIIRVCHKQTHVSLSISCSLSFWPQVGLCSRYTCIVYKEKS